jgi:hypothetical protein
MVFNKFTIGQDLNIMKSSSKLIKLNFLQISIFDKKNSSLEVSKTNLDECIFNILYA